MAQPWVSGPGHLYVQTNYSPGIPGITYLGVCEQTPRIHFTPRFSPVHSDVAGAQVPHDWIYDGKDADLFASALTVWNWSTLLAVMSRPNAVLPSAPGVPAASFGADVAGSRGTLMVTEGFSYTLWVQFPYYTKTAYGGFMPGGFRFPTSFLMGPDDLDLGTKANKIPISFHMASKQDASGNWILCDSNMSGIPAVPPVTLS